MSWWDRSIDAVRTHFSLNAGPGGRPSGTYAETTETSHEAWRDVPRLQRTLAEPITPVAINDRFRDSLAAFTDPSFLSPLSHQVDPSGGGLVAGLVSPGQPQTRGGPGLVVSQGAARPTPGVQRLATWSTASTEPELLTVPLEYPHEAASVTSEVALPAHEPLVTGSASAPPSATSDPPVAAAMAPTVGRSAPAPANLPPLVQRSPAPDLRTTTLHPLPTPIARSAAGEPAGDSPETIQTPEVSAAGPATEPTPGNGDEIEPPVTELQVVTPEPAADRAAALELPGPPAPAPSPSPRPSVQARTQSLQRSADGSRTDAPTLGARPESAALAAPSAALGQLVGPPDDPPVQRITYLPSHPGALPSTPSSSSPRDVAKGVNGPAHAGTQARLPTVQPMRELQSVQLPESAETTSRRSPGTVAAAAQPRVVGPPSHTEPQSDAALTAASTESGGSRTWPEVVVSRFEEQDHSSTDIDHPGFTQVPLVVAGSPARPSVGSTHESTIEHPNIHDEDEPSSATLAPPEWSGVTDDHSPVTIPDSLGPAVPVEPWTPAAAAVTPLASAGVNFVAQRAAPITAVQRQVANATSATLQTDPSLPRRRGPEQEPARPVHQPPLVVSRRAADQGLEIGPRAGDGMSFERMFSGASPSPTEAPFHTENAHSPVQREPVDAGPSGAGQSMSAATERGPAAAAPLSGGPGPAGGEVGANLDEMARRLYEPLAARLREELWLDRERAGLMSDA